ncbi:MAG: GNAT family N-acetyltransferase [Gloeomargaritaceae cyanobacterium C42_A2020_066]|nr:GNAT family N-acetyltransferase [Gloeomargaritaceae cyanobacterium C42_A2020_066]
MTLNGLVIRPAHLGDTPTLVALLGGGQTQIHVPTPLGTPPRTAWTWVQDWQERRLTYLALAAGRPAGLIQVRPCNRQHSTWKIEQVVAADLDTGTELMRHCLDEIRPARTWIQEVSHPDEQALSLCRQHGFHPLAQHTYWHLAGPALQALAAHPTDAAPLTPVYPGAARLLYQLDMATMPPLVRQVFDRQIYDFEVPTWEYHWQRCQAWLGIAPSLHAYVYEPQRQCAIGYLRLQINPHIAGSHWADWVVHPAYTWLYPQLLGHLARALQGREAQGLYLASADYQPTREDWLRQVGATPVAHTLLLCRTVWHKLREGRFAGLDPLQLADVLPVFQPAHPPVPSRLEMDGRRRFRPALETHLVGK